jgi:hypothetical protein
MSSLTISVSTASALLSILELEAAKRTGYQVFRDKDGKAFATDSIGPNGMRIRVPLRVLDQIKALLPVADKILGNAYETIYRTELIVNFDAPDFAERYKDIMASGGEGIKFIQSEIGDSLISMLPDELSKEDRGFWGGLMEMSNEFPDFLPQGPLTPKSILKALVDLPGNIAKAELHIATTPVRIGAFLGRVGQVITSRPFVVGSLLVVAAIATGVALTSGAAILAEVATVSAISQAQAGLLAAFLARYSVPQSIIKLILGARSTSQAIRIMNKYSLPALKTAFIGSIGLGSFGLALEQIGEAGLDQIHNLQKAIEKKNHLLKSIDTSVAEHLSGYSD